MYNKTRKGIYQKLKDVTQQLSEQVDCELKKRMSHHATKNYIKQIISSERGK